MNLHILLLIGQTLGEVAKLAVQFLTVHSIRMQGGTEHIVFSLLANSSCFNSAAGISWLLSLAGILTFPASSGVNWRLSLGLRLILGTVFIDCAWISVGWIR